MTACGAAALLLAGLLYWQTRPSPAASAFARGRALAAGGLTADARALYEESVRDDAGFAPAYRAMAELDVAAGDWPSALADWRAYVAHERRPLHGWCRVAEIELRLGMQVSAQRDAEHELTLDPACGIAHFVAGLIYEHRAAPYLAVQHLSRAAAAMPDDARVLTAYGRVLVRSRNLPDAIRTLQQALKFDPDRAEALRWLGAAYAQLPATPQNTRLAEESLERALKVRPGYAEAAYELGSLCLREGRLLEAKALAERASAERRHYLHALYLLARVNRALGRQEEADRKMAEFRRENNLVLRTDALQIRYRQDPSSTATAVELAKVLLSRDEPAEAVRYLQDAERHRPGDPRLAAARTEAEARLQAVSAQEGVTPQPGMAAAPTAIPTSGDR